MYRLNCISYDLCYIRSDFRVLNHELGRTFMGYRRRTIPQRYLWLWFHVLRFIYSSYFEPAQVQLSDEKLNDKID